MTAQPVCVVAGAGPGVGRAVARRFAREGFSVALLARRHEALDAMAAEMTSEGAAARGFAVDLTDAAALRAALLRVAAEVGAPGVLVYNASSRWAPGPALALEPAAFAAELALCVTGALVATQAVVPAMQAAGGGTVLYTGGGLALAPEYGGEVPGLTAGKSALRGLALAIAPEVAAAGVHLGIVTIAGLVEPGGRFDPDRIADEYWTLHVQPRAAWTVETVFRGAD